MEKWDFVNWLRNYEFKVLPNIGSNYFVCKPVYNFNEWNLVFVTNVRIEQEVTQENLIGWIVEFRLAANTPGVSSENWARQKKIYETREVAMHAILQMKQHYSNYEWQIKAIYIYDKQSWRNHIIYEVLK